MEKNILFGDSNYILKILKSFPTILEHIEFVVGSNLDYSENIDGFDFMGIQEFFSNTSLYYNDIVISSDWNYSELESMLVNEIKNDNKIIYARDWFKELLKDENFIHMPRSIRIDLSTVCQLNCVDCYMRKNNSGTMGTGYVTFERFKNFMDYNTYIDKVEVSNSGEVFLNPDLEKILEYCYSNNIIVTMANGVNFNTVSDRVIESLVKYQVREIRISIDGTNQSTYSKYRRNGNFNRVIKNIEKLNDYKKKYNSFYPILIWQYIIMNHNQNEMEMARELAESHDMTIYYKLDWSSNFKAEDPKKVSKLVGFDILQNSDFAYFSCNQLFFEPQINWDGRLLGCCTVFEDDWNLNVFDGSYFDALNSKNYRQTLINLLGENENIDCPCSRCYLYRKMKDENYKIYI